MPYVVLLVFFHQPGLVSTVQAAAGYPEAAVRIIQAVSCCCCFQASTELQWLDWIARGRLYYQSKSTSFSLWESRDAAKSPSVISGLLDMR